MKTNFLIYPASVSCNLRCGYCFHRNKNQGDLSRKMEIETLELFFRNCEGLSQNGENEVEIIWHGGEPLLAGIDFYRKAIDIISKQFPGNKKIVHCLQTNGVLINKSWADFFKNNNFKVGLSIDGPEELHNVNRKTKNGRGSFNDVMSAVNIFSEYGLSFGVVVVANNANVKYPNRVFDFIRRLGVNKIQISPCIEPAEIKEKNSFSVTPKEFAHFICELYDLWLEEDNPKISIGYIEDIVDALLGGECYNCLLSDGCHNFAVLDWNGDVRPCEDLFGEKIIFGNIKTVSLEKIFAGKIYKNFYAKISKRRNQVCKDCEWFEMCKGGCPHHWRDFDSGKTALCEANKIIFKHISNSLYSLYSKEP